LHHLKESVPQAELVVLLSPGLVVFPTIDTIEP